MIIVHIDDSFWSTEAITPACGFKDPIHILIKLLHSLSLLAAGHLTQLCSDWLLSGWACDAWRQLSLWGDSIPGSSCISQGAGTVDCATCSPIKYFILAWWIFRHMHIHIVHL